MSTDLMDTIRMTRLKDNSTTKPMEAKIFVLKFKFLNITDFPYLSPIYS
ncbi:hypothetical protein DOT_4377 [Desulfosporosinus sp. OT]|nr:hypothetical protein DOT_4377 [Desulfosporosinus sp. OT]